jgi:hypothetical protein
MEKGKKMTMEHGGPYVPLTLRELLRRAKRPIEGWNIPGSERLFLHAFHLEYVRLFVSNEQAPWEIRELEFNLG